MILIIIIIIVIIVLILIINFVGCTCCCMLHAHRRIAMSRQTTLFGEFVSPAKKRLLELDVRTIRKANEVFRETWKGKAPWPQLQLLCEETNDHPETKLIYKQDEGMFCKLCQKWQKVPRSGAPVWTM